MSDETNPFVERAALAMAGEVTWGPHHNDAIRTYFRERVRKVLMVMREPTSRMIELGGAAGVAAESGADVVPAIWRAMVEEAGHR